MILKGKTQKGKNRIRENGTEWSLQRTESTVLFSSQTGPWGLVSPVTDKTGEKARWIHLVSDVDFEIVG